MYYATIPIFVIQLLLLSVAIFAIATGSNNAGSGSRRHDEEKTSSEHELRQVRQASFETKSESPKSVQTGGKGTKGVQFA